MLCQSLCATPPPPMGWRESVGAGPPGVGSTATRPSAPPKINMPVIHSATWLWGVSAGRPVFPALYITDITNDPANPYAGDWQFGGTGIPPHAVFGTWKAARICGRSRLMAAGSGPWR